MRAERTRNQTILIRICEVKSRATEQIGRFASLNLLKIIYFESFLLFFRSVPSRSCRFTPIRSSSEIWYNCDGCYVFGRMQCKQFESFSRVFQDLWPSSVFSSWKIVLSHSVSAECHNCKSMFGCEGVRLCDAVASVFIYYLCITIRC